MSLALPLAAAAALLLFGGGSKKAKKPAARPQQTRVTRAPGGVQIRAKPKAAPRGTVTVGPVKVIKSKPPAVTKPSSLTAPLARAASQGGSPPLAAPLSADIPVDHVPPAAQRATAPRSPSGYDPNAARRSAPSLTNHLRRTGKAKYDRKLLKQFQTHAGLKPDGLYGPGTRGALVYFGQKDPPAAFSGTGTTPYKPPV